MNNRNDLKNIVYTFIGQLIVLGLGLVVPRYVLTGYGSDTNGLLSTVGQIVAYMSILEAGIGQAARNELYQFVQGNSLDKRSVSAIMAMSRKTYRKMTKIYALAVIVLSLMLPVVIRTELDYPTVSIVMLIEGFSGVVSFYYIQERSNLLTVDGKQYVNSNVDLIFKGIIYLVKITVALLGINIIIMELGAFVAILIKLLVYDRYMKKHYGWIDYSSDIGERSLKDRNAYVITEVAWTVFSSTDMIVISIFCSTKSSSVYAIYYMVFLTINKLADALFTSLKYNLGQAYHKDIGYYKETHDLFNSIFIGAISAVLAVAYYLCIPFISLYTRGIDDIEYIDRYLPLGFCLMLLLSWGRMVSEHLIGVAGLARKLSVVSILEVAINIILSVILVNCFGIRGVLYATVAALLLKVIYCNILADKKILGRSVIATVKILSANYLLFAIIVVSKRLIEINIGSYVDLLIYGVIFTICSVTIFLIVNVLVNRRMAGAIKRLLRGNN